MHLGNVRLEKAIETGRNLCSFTAATHIISTMKKHYMLSMIAILFRLLQASWKAVVLVDVAVATMTLVPKNNLIKKQGV